MANSTDTGRRVEVVIGSEIITLKLSSDKSPEYAQRLARYAAAKIEEVKAKSMSAAIDDHMCTLLIALNIADDYHRALEKSAELEKLCQAGENYRHRCNTLEAEVKRLDRENRELREKYEPPLADMGAGTESETTSPEPSESGNMKILSLAKNNTAKPEIKSEKKPEKKPEKKSEKILKFPGTDTGSSEKDGD